MMIVIGSNNHESWLCKCTSQINVRWSNDECGSRTVDLYTINVLSID